MEIKKLGDGVTVPRRPFSRAAELCLLAQPSPSRQIPKTRAGAGRAALQWAHGAILSRCQALQPRRSTWRWAESRRDNRRARMRVGAGGTKSTEAEPCWKNSTRDGRKRKDGKSEEGNTKSSHLRDATRGRYPSGKLSLTRLLLSGLGQQPRFKPARRAASADRLRAWFSGWASAPRSCR